MLSHLSIMMEGKITRIVRKNVARKGDNRE
jgi:hypothetical protein